MENIKNLNLALFWSDQAGSEVSFTFSCFGVVFNDLII
jgi:hypothetical protein